MLITGYEYYDPEGYDGHICTNGRVMSDDDDRLRSIICFCVVLITDEIIWLC